MDATVKRIPAWIGPVTLVLTNQEAHDLATMVRTYQPDAVKGLGGFTFDYVQRKRDFAALNLEQKESGK